MEKWGEWNSPFPIFESGLFRVSLSNEMIGPELLGTLKMKNRTETHIQYQTPK
jgi:hypothetical protein